MPSAGGEAPLDWASIGALVSGLLVCAAPVGVGLGIAGVVRTKGGRRRGRWAAVVGLVVSSLISAAGVIALVVGGLLFASSWTDDLDPAEARAGECIDLDWAEFPNSTSCDGEHEGEVVWVGQIDEATAQAWREARYVDDFCLGRELTEAHASAVQDPAYTVDYFVDGGDWEPTPGDWMLCYLIAAEGHLDGPVGSPPR